MTLKLRCVINSHSTASLQLSLKLEPYISWFLLLLVGHWGSFILRGVVVMVRVVMILRVIEAFFLLKIRIFGNCSI